jgi:hypothetical protein
LESRRIRKLDVHNRLKINKAQNGMAIAIYKGASDVPAAGKFRSAHKKAGTRQEHPPRAALIKGDRPGEPAIGTVEKPPAVICWEASDQHGNTKRHSFEWRFVHLVHHSCALCPDGRIMRWRDSYYLS